MSLYCESDYSDGDDFGWWWEAHPSFDVKPLATKRSRKCFDINEPLKDQISEFNAGLGR